MLTGLLLQNIALIESLELEFSSGFTVLTGETGAGKSILLDALDAVLGGAQGSSAFVCCGRVRIAPGSRLRFNSTQPWSSG